METQAPAVHSPEFLQALHEKLQGIEQSFHERLLALEGKATSEFDLKGLESKVASFETSLSALATQVGDDISGVKGSVSTLSSRLSAVETTVSGQKAVVDQLGRRVAGVEAKPSPAQSTPPPATSEAPSGEPQTKSGSVPDATGTSSS